MKILSFILDISSGKSICIKFLKDPSTRGNSPNFYNQKMKMKPIPLSIKPVNNSSSSNSDLSNSANLVKLCGIGPTRMWKRICQQDKMPLSFKSNLKSC